MDGHGYLHYELPNGGSLVHAASSSAIEKASNHRT
jgi:hypothetical protein